MELQSKLKDYAACFDESPVALAVLRVLKDESGTASDFEYLYCNDAFAFIEGAARGQIIGRRHYERYPDAGGKWLEFYNRAVTSGSARSSGDFSAEHNKFLSVRAFSIGEDCCAAMPVDVSRDKRLEFDTRRQLALYRALDKVGIFTAKLDDSLTLVYGSESFYAMLGMSREGLAESVGNRCAELIFPDELAAVNEAIQAAFDAGERGVSGELRVRAGEGRESYLQISCVFENSPKHGHIINGVADDISEQRLARLELESFEREAERRYVEDEARHAAALEEQKRALEERHSLAFEQRMSALEGRHSLELERVKAIADEELSLALEQKKDELEEKSAGELEQLNENHKQELEKLARESEEAREELQRAKLDADEKYARELEGLKTEADERLACELDALRKELEEKHLSETEKQNAEFEEKLASELERQSAELAQKHSEELDKLSHDSEKAHERELERVKQEADKKFVLALEEAKRELEQKHALALEEQRRSLEEQRSASRQLRVSETEQAETASAQKRRALREPDEEGEGASRAKLSLYRDTSPERERRRLRARGYRFYNARKARPRVAAGVDPEELIRG